MSFNPHTPDAGSLSGFPAGSARRLARAELLGSTALTVLVRCACGRRS